MFILEQSILNLCDFFSIPKRDFFCKFLFPNSHCCLDCKFCILLSMSRVTAKDDKKLPPAKLAMYEYLTTPGITPRGLDFKLLQKVAVYTIATLVIFIVVATGFQYISNTEVSANPGFVSEVQNYKEKLSKLTILPAEDPTVDIVDDTSKFSQYSFSNDLKVGDVILSFKTAQKYYAYRESNFLVGIHTGALTPIPEIDTPQTVTSASSTQSEAVIVKYRVKILNGSTLSGIGTELETKLNSKFASEVKVSSVESAKNKIYKSNKIVIINERAREMAQKIASEFNCEIISMPTNEASTGNADIVIITGRP